MIKHDPRDLRGSLGASWLKVVICFQARDLGGGWEYHAGGSSTKEVSGREYGS